jgi:two-component system, response regulator PdtaR
MRILIADDESIIRLGLKSMLQEMGHLVLAASNGREALQMARHHQPDMAILDIKMPYTDGLQVARVLSQTMPMPILLLTAFSETDLIERATDLPIHGYLVKPIQPGELAAAIAVARKRFDESLALLASNEKLRETLAMRKLVDQAKGKLMETGLSEAEAYRLMQQQARDARQNMGEVARKILQKL